MGKIIAGVVAFFGLSLLLLGSVFIIAGGTDNLIAGGAMALLGLGLLAFAFFMLRLEAQKPTIVQQTMNVQLGGAGEFREREIKCSSCGGTIPEKNVSVVAGGIQATCPFCGKAMVMEEEPKW